MVNGEQHERTGGNVLYAEVVQEDRMLDRMLEQTRCPIILSTWRNPTMDRMDGSRGPPSVNTLSQAGPKKRLAIDIPVTEAYSRIAQGPFGDGMKMDKLWTVKLAQSPSLVYPTSTANISLPQST